MKIECKKNKEKERNGLRAKRRNQAAEGGNVGSFKVCDWKVAH